MSLLAVDRLSIGFGSAEVVKDVSFTIAPGEMLALVGESGSGKSLTALACMGLLPAQARVSGSIIYEGQELVGAPQAVLRKVRGQKIGMVFQEPMTALNPLHTIGRQIREACGVQQEQASAAQHVAQLLDQVGLPYLKDRIDAYPHQLSGGERQRVMIAMAIANRPALLIADEPTTAVDVTVQLKLLQLLKKMQQTLPMAVLLITHDLTIVRRLADRVAVMSEGAIVETGVTAALFKNPSHPYTRHLLGSEPQGTAAPLEASSPILIASEGLRVNFAGKKRLFKPAEVFKAVDDVTLSIPQGATLGVVGESGSGKTTLGFALLRLIKSEGRIVYLGRDINLLQTKTMRPLRREMQLVFQDPFSSLNPRMTVRQIIEEGLLVHHPDKTPLQRDSEIDAILHDVGLSPAVKDRYPHEFSGGQRQRISIARAMILRPRFVILDEPTSALDLSIQSQIIELLQHLQQKFGLTMMFISHDLRVVRAIAHRIIVMHKGRVVEEGETAAIFEHPQHDYTKTLINAAFLKG